MGRFLKTVLGIVIVCLCLAACTDRTKGEMPETPESAAETAMYALKTMDLDTFNAVSDNYVRTCTNWIGIPTEKEYRVFNELQQPMLFKGRKYRANKKFAEKIVENLSWETGDVQKDGDQAEIKMRITNTDMSDVMGYYMIGILERTIKAEGSGLKQMIRDLSNIDYDKEGILSYMDQTEETCFAEVTVRAYQEDGGWKVHISDSFTNAFMGNLNSEHFSEDVEKRLCELEDEYEQKIEQKWEQWGDYMMKEKRLLNIRPGRTKSDRTSGGFLVYCLC